MRHHRVLQGQAADSALGHRGGGDDHPRRRHHQVRAQAARAVRRAGERARVYIFQFKGLVSYRQHLTTQRARV